jgi:AcrR family transcriptional regulator
MARPVNADAEATKKRILQRACALISAHGIEGTSVRDVATASEISLATVLHYYGSKEGLYQACVDAMRAELRELRQSLVAAIQPGQSPSELITAMVLSAWEFCRAHRPAHLLLLRSVLDRGFPQDQIDDWLKPAIDDVESVLAPAIGMPKEEAGLAFQSMVHLLVRYALNGPAELMVVTRTTTMADAERRIGEHLAHLGRTLFVRP